MSGRTSAFWGCLPITRLYESRAQVTLENPGQISTVLIYGDNAEIGLRALGDGRFAKLWDLIGGRNSDAG